MSKTGKTTHDLVASDFRELQKLLARKYNREYSVDYIRKVCKGTRNNPDIKIMAKNYVNVMEKKRSMLDELAK